MPVKPDGKQFTIREQIIDHSDGAAGLVISVEHVRDDVWKLVVCSVPPKQPLPFGNYEFIFEDGAECGGGTYLCGRPRPTWLRDLDDQETNP